MTKRKHWKQNNLFLLFQLYNIMATLYITTNNFYGNLSYSVNNTREEAIDDCSLWRGSEATVERYEIDDDDIDIESEDSSWRDWRPASKDRYIHRTTPVFAKNGEIIELEPVTTTEIWRNEEVLSFQYDEDTGLYRDIETWELTERENAVKLEYIRTWELR